VTLPSTCRGPAEPAVEAHRLPGLNAEEHDDLNLEIEGVTDSHAVRETVVVDVDGGALNPQHLADQRGDGGELGPEQVEDCAGAARVGVRLVGGQPNTELVELGTSRRSWVSTAVALGADRDHEAAARLAGRRVVLEMDTPPYCPQQALVMAETSCAQAGRARQRGWLLSAGGRYVLRAPPPSGVRLGGCGRW
jgi:hypothetical protein